MSIVCLTGWQQPADALEVIAPGAIHANYADHTSTADFFASLPAEADLAIGWSLGGQLLVRAVASGHIKPKRIVLLGAPFQFLAGLIIPHGMPSEMFAGVVTNYRSTPQEMLEGFCSVIAAGDSHAPSITRTLKESVSVWKNGMFWLKELGRFSCADLKCPQFPPTLVIHGNNDKVVYAQQAQLFKNAIPNAQVHLLDQCAHAPHLHDPAAIQGLIEQHV